MNDFFFQYFLFQLIYYFNVFKMKKKSLFLELINKFINNYFN